MKQMILPLAAMAVLACGGAYAASITKVTTPAPKVDTAAPATAPSAVTATASPSVGTVPTGRALAQAVAQMMPLDQQVNEFTEGMSKTLPADKQALFKSIMKKNVDITQLRVAATDALLKTYSETELRTMYDFYSKPEAQAVMRKLSQFGQAMQPTVEGMMQKAVAESQKAGLFSQ